LASQQPIFNTSFYHAAFEDVELGFRLSRKGLRLIYAENAIAEHNHELTVRSFVNRQRRAGQMLTLLALVQPEYVSTTHSSFLTVLEHAVAHNRLKDELVKGFGRGVSEQTLESLTSICELEFMMDRMFDPPFETDLIEQNSLRIKNPLEHTRVSVWEALNNFALRIGMADEWAQNDKERLWARDFITLLVAPSVMRPADPSQMPLAIPCPSYVAQGRRIFFQVARFCQRTPGLDYVFARLKSNSTARRFKEWLLAPGAR
jgi:hypothetical protein